MTRCALSRRGALGSILTMAASPLATVLQAQEPGLLDLVNVHEFEAYCQKKLHKLAYDFIAGGVEDEQTLRANRAAFEKVFVVPRLMRDVSKIDTSTTVLGVPMPVPLIIAPTGGKNLVLPNADEVVAQAALATKTPICSATGVSKILEEGQPLHWWSNTTGNPNRTTATAYAKRIEDSGGKAIVVTVDNAYQSNRDRNNRNKFDYGYMQTGIPKEGEKRPPRSPATPAMWGPHTPNMTWDYIGWLRAATKVSIIVKGILAPEDAELAVKNGAHAVVVSNHGGRQLDGAPGSLTCLPEVAQAVGGRIPVLMDGGIRRGIDMVKAIAMGADAVLVGRAPLWGLGAFGREGVERVLWMLGAEFKLAMALAGATNVAELRKLKVKVIP
ncbi:MAG: alpha-hydroxy-acid oxidizing protein [Acidobacteria bacterium]|nr:alpha-hydroxy-acid oxidizing protein [Acidobacteriota bacterium]